MVSVDRPGYRHTRFVTLMMSNLLFCLHDLSPQKTRTEFVSPEGDNRVDNYISYTRSPDTPRFLHVSPTSPPLCSLQVCVRVRASTHVCVCVCIKQHLMIKKKAVSHHQYHVGETEVKTNQQARIWTSRSMGKKTTKTN